MNAKWSLFSAVLFLCLVAAGIAVASSRTSNLNPEARLSAPELPREWVWKKQAVQLDDMYGRKPHAL